jgi:hypothetical protein
MVSSAVSVESVAAPLEAIRRVLDGADEALFGVAFVHQRGVNLLKHQLTPVPEVRLVATTVFGSTTADGLTAAHEHGARVRVLNPVRGTFHPKVYLARHGDRLAAAIGSANLTSGLIANVESAVVLEVPCDAPALWTLWERAESWWAHEDAVDWSPSRVLAPAETLHPELLAMIAAAVAADRVFMTLGRRPRPNTVHEVTADGVWVETVESVRKGRPPQRVPAWMIQLAWDWLQAHGRLTQKHLLADDGLSVKRSAFVCALLARLPGMELVSASPVELGLDHPDGRGTSTI